MAEEEVFHHADVPGEIRFSLHSLSPLIHLLFHILFMTLQIPLLEVSGLAFDVL